MKQKLYNINESTLDSLLHRVKVLESVLIEGKKDQEILNNFLGDDYYNKYQSIKNKIKDPEYKDIYKLIKKDLGDVKDYIDNIQSSRDIRRSDKQGAKLIYSDDTWNVYKITTYDAAKYYGKGTKWCIVGNYDGHEERGEKYFNDYIVDYDLDGGYYFYINKSNGDKYCLLQNVNNRVQSIWDASDDDLGTKNTVEMMLPVVPGVNLKAVNPTAALLDGVRKGDVVFVKNALSMGADINKIQYGFKTALMLAAFNGYLEIAKLLIDEGADVNVKNRFGVTALMNAALQGHTEIVKLLINAGADVNIKDENGLTALMRAASNGQREIVKLLIDAGADANIKDRFGDTALMRAVYSGRIEIVKLLLDVGADVNAKDRRGLTALNRTLEKGHNDIAELLIKYGAKSESRKNKRLNRKYLY